MSRFVMNRCPISVTIRPNHPWRTCIASPPDRIACLFLGIPKKTPEGLEVRRVRINGHRRQRQPVVMLEGDDLGDPESGPRRPDARPPSRGASVIHSSNV